MRYSRQETYKNINKHGQQKLNKGHIVLVGVGALGSVAAELLCRAGIGKITLIDRDYVEEHNLQRQSLYTEKDIGEAKAVAASRHLKEINSTISVVSHVTDLHSGNVDLLKQADVLVDGTDNMETRFLINDYCRKNNIPWVYGSAIRDEGYVKVFTPTKECFRCLFAPVSGLETCDTSGALNSVTHLVASLQVSFVIQLLLQKNPSQKLFHINAWKPSLEEFFVKKKNACPCCKGRYTFLSENLQTPIIKFCGSRHYQIRGKPLSLKLLAKRVRGSKNFESCLRFRDITFFPDGRALITASSPEEAERLYFSVMKD